MCPMCQVIPSCLVHLPPSRFHTVLTSFLPVLLFCSASGALSLLSGGCPPDMAVQFSLPEYLG